MQSQENQKRRCSGCLIWMFNCLSSVKYIRQALVRQIAYRPPECTYVLRPEEASHEYAVQSNFQTGFEEITSPLMNERALKTNNMLKDHQDIPKSPIVYFQPSHQNRNSIQQRKPQDIVKYPPYKLKLLTLDRTSCDIEPLNMDGNLFATISIQGYVLDTYDDHKIGSIFIECTGSDSVILFSHGNSTDLGIMLNSLMDMATQLQINVFAYEYSGYGWSSGDSSDLNCIHDIFSAYNFLIDQMGFTSSQIIIYGFSIGSGPSTVLSSAVECGGLIIHSGLSSGLKVLDPTAKSSYYDIFPNIDYIRKVHAPTFILHGGDDSMINVVHAEQLALACQHLYSVWLVEQGGHCNIEDAYREQYLQRLRNYLQYCRTAKQYPGNIEPLNHIYSSLIEELKGTASSLDIEF